MSSTVLSAADPVVSRPRALLTCGVVAGPLFIALVANLALTRPGFDLKRHPLSLLSLGDLGWIQTTNFVLAGVLAFAGAVGVRRVLSGGRAGTWGPVLFGAYGVALAGGGIFSTDPAFGFPPGTPDGQPAQLSWHGVLHAMAPTAAAIALIAAGVVFARRYLAQRRRGWLWYSVVTVVANLVLTGAAFAAGDFRLIFAGG